MSTPSSPYSTFSQIRLAIINDAKESTNSAMVALVNRWINEGHEQVTFRKKRDWLDQQFTVQLSSCVQKTCTVTLNSTTVTFPVGTTFVSGIDLQFQNQGFQEIYNVVSATLNVLTLDKPYLGPTSTSAAGVVFQPSFLLDPSIRAVYQTYHNYNSQDLMDVGPQELRQIQTGNGAQFDYAQVSSIFGQNNATGARRMFIYPYPDVAYTLYIDANTYCPQLVNDSDQPVLPIQYRQVLYWFGLHKLWLYHRNNDQAANAKSNFDTMLAKMDAEMRAEIEFPQITVKYPKTRTLRIYAPPFDTGYRNN